MEPARIPVAFARVLRGAGVATPVSAVVSFTEALGIVGVGHRDRVYWAARATLVRRPEDIEPFDRAFAVFFDQRRSGGEATEPEPPQPVRLVVDTDDTDDGDDVADPAPEDDIELRFSVAEVLRHRDFADYSDHELAEARRWMAKLRVVGSPRRSLRLTPTRRRTRRPDLRRTVRAAVRTRGDPLERHYRTPATRYRRIVLLLDVSGSMEPYARALLRFVQAAVAGRRRIEAFTLGTRLTRVTRELGSHDPDVALNRAADSVHDWSGGTRLGDGIAQFTMQWGARGMARGADVVVLSDGWDRGDPAHLAEQMQRLQRLANRVIWVNPLKVTPGYAPLARGMAAALPYVDEFVEGHSLDALERLTEVLNRA
ncbi:MAG: VWA domain-containing protein [Actinomycetota bacterium]|nr:VWA domain-containing protein [Actinomycetota bacterium]